MTDSDSIKSALVQYRKSLQADFDNIIQKESLSIKIDSETSGQKKMKEKTEAELKALAEDLPVIKNC